MEMKSLHNERSGVQNGDSKPFIPQSSNRMMFPGRSGPFGNYQPSRSDKPVLIITIVLNCAMLLLACGALFVGIYLITYRGSYADLCSDNEWFVAAGCMLGVGSLLFIFVVVVFIGICYKSSRVLTIYILVLIFLFLGEMAAGIYAFARRDYIEDRFKACMLDAYQNEYRDPKFEHVTKAWDKFQEKFDCCGVTKSTDYFANNKFPNAPKSCGGEKADAFAKQPCFKVIKREVLDNFYIIGGSAVGLAFIQLLAIIMNLFLLRIFHKREEYA